jgi:histidinol-phosphate aminotransferase
MSRFFDLVSKAAREMGGYTPHPPAQHAREFQPRLIRLDSNENPFGPSPHAIEAMRAALAGAHAYPDDECTELRRKLAAHHGLPPEQVLVTAGSTALLSLLCQTLLVPGLNAVTSERSFIVYSLAVHATGVRLIEAPMRNDAFDLEAILQAIDGNTRLVFVANPNNPTGTMISEEIVDRFLSRVPGHVVVVLDEAYYEFAVHLASAGEARYPDSVDYVRRGASVVVLRTFSKAHGLAGLRIGYGLGPAELLTYCARMRNTFSVASVAQRAAIAAIDDRCHIERVVANNTAQAKVLAGGLSELGYRVVPTCANFVYSDVTEYASTFADRLLQEGISVRPLGPWGAPNCIRVSIGTPEQNQFFLHGVRRMASKGSTMRMGEQFSGFGS